MGSSSALSGSPVAPEPLELRGAQADVSEDAAESADLERLIAMHRHRGVVTAPRQEVVAAADAEHSKPLPLQEPNELLAADPRQSTHAAYRRGRSRRAAA